MSCIGAFALACTSQGSASTSTDSETGSDSTDTSDTDESETDSTDDADSTDDTDDEAETGDPDPACESEEPTGDWFLSLPDDAVFPDDIPENVDENCTVLAAPQEELALDCPFGEFSVILLVTPMPPLPVEGEAARVRIHHEPGWKNWPDMWIDVEVEGGDHYAFQASSALLPGQGSYEVPWAPSETTAECGPFSLGDSCGEQVGKELGFDVDGEQVTAWHGGYASAVVDDLHFEAWINVAREYTSPPETCDFSPTWYSLVTRRQGAG